MDNWHYRLDNFVVGSCNEVAYKASRLVLQPHFPTYYSPLLIIGDTGSGKTHLLQGLYENLKRSNPLLASKVIYSTADRFVIDYTTAFRTNKLDSFTKMHLGCAAWLVDDIHKLANKRASQRQFVTLFDTLLNQGKKIVLSSNESPNQLAGLEDRLASRLNAGLSVRLKKPDYQTRLSILNTICLSQRKRVDNEVVDYLARRVDTDLHDLFEAARKVLLSPQTVSQPGPGKPTEKGSLEAIARTVDRIINQSQKPDIKNR